MAGRNGRSTRIRNGMRPTQADPSNASTVSPSGISRWTSSTG